MVAGRLRAHDNNLSSEQLKERVSRVQSCTKHNYGADESSFAGSRFRRCEAEPRQAFSERNPKKNRVRICRLRRLSGWPRGRTGLPQAQAKARRQAQVTLSSELVRLEPPDQRITVFNGAAGDRHIAIEIDTPAVFLPEGELRRDFGPSGNPSGFDRLRYVVLPRHPLWPPLPVDS